jgi:hypothetical protein
MQYPYIFNKVKIGVFLLYGGISRLQKELDMIPELKHTHDPF